MRKQVTLFTSRTCAPCNLLKPILAKIRAEHGFDLTIVDASPNTQEEFQARGIRAVPTLVVLEGETEITRHSGGMTEAKLIEFLKGAGVM